MRWFRANIRFGSRLALFALAVQIVLSFGHVHVSDLAAGTGPNALVVADASGNGHSRNAPAPGALDPACAICALIQLASTSAPSTAPVVLPPTLVGHMELDAPDQAVLATSPPAHFRARAPPLA